MQDIIHSHTISKFWTYPLPCRSINFLDDYQYNLFGSLCHHLTKSTLGIDHQICSGGYNQEKISIQEYGVKNIQKIRNQGLLQRISHLNDLSLCLCFVLDAFIPNMQRKIWHLNTLMILYSLYLSVKTNLALCLLVKIDLVIQHTIKIKQYPRYAVLWSSNHLFSYGSHCIYIQGDKVNLHYSTHSIFLSIWFSCSCKFCENHGCACIYFFLMFLSMYFLHNFFQYFHSLNKHNPQYRLFHSWSIHNITFYSQFFYKGSLSFFS